ncbi:hypothetical protein [Ktedonospora formicarum]|uniref:TIR domain-containing protein n=1 Tax=Ktedonospora formicarum TaxID=2778364 RepID=A0A8J3I8V3_9CHLR|nr:hypothetical protein [Ktedonospora formicarum]GHO47569.1 hypothetical protein KSX_57320 [Ktedonospora formicarum]
MALRIFVLHAPEDSACADQIHHSGQALGYQIWHISQPPKPHETISPTSRELMILGSAALLLVWSQAAAQSDEVERLLLFAQRLQKQIVVLALDRTVLPTTLTVSPIITQLPCDQCMAQLGPLLPPPATNDTLQALAEQASHEYIRERKAAIEQAELMLQRNEQREAVLALLEHLARHDTITSVRDKAHDVLDRYTQPASQPVQTPLPSTHIQDQHALFGVRCKHGHVSYFDKRYVCKASSPVPRGHIQRAGKELDELILSCTTCGETIIAHVDCEGYK